VAQFDLSTEFGKRVENRLLSEQVIWIVTVTEQGIPQPSPVWFHWDKGAIVIHSQPNTPKVRAIRANKNVALHFNATPSGGDVVVIGGTATLVDEGEVSTPTPEYAAKYASGYAELGLTNDTFAQSYSQLIRVEPSTMRGF
jgi:PPOX class probable F420-dependent enzyme